MRLISQLAAISTGYAQAGLNYLMALDAAGYEDFGLAIPEGSPGVVWRHMPSWTAPLMRIRKTTPQLDDLCIIHHTPEAVTNTQLRRGLLRNVALTVTETDRIPRYIARALGGLDAVIVPTEWNKQVFVAAGLAEDRVFAVPHAQGPWLWEDAPPLVPTSKPYVFYYIGAWNNRKNPRGVLEAYLRAFPKVTGETMLLMKISGNVGNRQTAEAILAEAGALHRLKAPRGDAGPAGGQDIAIYSDTLDGGGTWSDKKIRWLHEMGDCYVAPYRGEGWNLPAHTAALLGRAVIYTDWSAPRDFLSAGAGDMPIGYKMVDAGEQGGANSYWVTVGSQRPMQWAEPNLDEVAAAMQHAVATRPKRSAEHLAHLRHTYCWAAVGHRLVATMNAVMAAPPSAVRKPLAVEVISIPPATP